MSLGQNQSQDAGGGFNDQPPGHWTPIKLFLGEGQQEGEVFLNLNPVIKKGQFSIKDAEYGDIVLAHLARVPVSPTNKIVRHGIEAEKGNLHKLFDLAERFRNATDPKVAKRLGDKLGRIIFGG